MEDPEWEVKSSKTSKGYGKIVRKNSYQERCQPPVPSQNLSTIVVVYIEDMKEIKKRECKIWDKRGLTYSPGDRKCRRDGVIVPKQNI